MLSNISEKNKKIIYWSFIGLMGVIAIYTIGSMYMYDQEKKEMVAQVDRELMKTSVVNLYNTNPITVDIINLSNNEKLNNIVITKQCSNYKTSYTDDKLMLTRVLNVKIETGEKFYTYEDSYQALCNDKLEQAK